MTEETEDTTLSQEEMIQILKDKGITMSIGGCGCCGSPGVTFTYEGKTFDAENVNFNM